MNDKQLFTSSPFALTANPETAACWAGRKEIAQKLKKLCGSYAGRSDSSLDVIWANLGSGKSHALFRLQYLIHVDAQMKDRVLNTYVEMPEQIRKFHDLYRRIIASVPLDQIMLSVVNASQHMRTQNLVKASRAFVHGGYVEKELARDWILGERPDLRELRRATGIDSRIETDPVACDVLSDVVFAIGKGSQRFLLLLDEFQRIGILKEPARSTILSNLRSIFSRNASHFSVVLAVASRVEQSALELLPRELRTLMGIRPTISLPEMNSVEAFEFSVQRLESFRPPNYSGHPTAPFGDDGLRTALEIISSHGSAKMKPRTILQVLAWLFDLIDQETVVAIPPEKVRELLADVQWENE